MTERTSTKRAAIYLRQSLDRAEGIERQRERAVALITARGWELVDTFEDNDTPASKRRGAETSWGRMLGRVGKDFTVIVSVDLDRLLRSTRDLNVLIDLGAEVVTVDGEIDLTTADGEFRATMLAGIARFETRRTSERIKRQKRQRAENGEWHGGATPFGYKAENKKLVKQKDEVELIREAVRRLLDDREPMHWIIKDWNHRGTPTRNGRHWRQSNLRAILLNRSLLGETKAGVVGWKPILEAREYDRLHALLTDPSRKTTHSPGVKGGKYSMGGGLTVCGKCGKPLTSQTRYGVGTPSLICNKQVQGPDPDKHPMVQRVVAGKDVMQDTGRVRIDHDSLETYVFGQVTALLENTPRWHERMAADDPGLNEKIDALEAQRSALRDQRDRAGHAFIAGIMTEADAKRAVDRVDAILQGIEGSINDLLGRPILADVLSGGVDWESWSAGRRRTFLKLLIERIEVNDWKKGMTRNASRMKTETDEEYEERRKKKRQEAVAERVNIVWKWEE